MSDDKTIAATRCGVVASIQYAIAHLDNKLIVVLGHQNCGAVTAALKPTDETTDEPPELQQLLNRIRPAIAGIDPTAPPDRRLADAIEANARSSARQLGKVPFINNALVTSEVRIVSAVYQLDSGQIKFLK